MAALAFIFNSVIDIYVFVIFVMIVMSWLLTFNVINRHNQFVDLIWRTVMSLTEPVLRPIRNMLPNMNGLDLSPLVLLILLKAIQIFGNNYIFLPAIKNGL